MPATPSASSAASAARSPSATAASSRSSRRGPRRAARRRPSALAGDDLLPQRRVAGGDPGDVADALPGERQVAPAALGEPAGDQRRPAGAAGARCGPRPGRARPGVSRTGDARRTARPAPRTSATAVGVGGLVRGDRPRPAVEEGRARPRAGRTARCRPSGGCRRSGPASGAGRPATAASGPALTLPTSVTTASDAAPARRRSRRRGGRAAPRRRPAAAGRRAFVGAAGAEPEAVRRCSARDVGEEHLEAGAAGRPAPIEVPSSPAPTTCDRAGEAQHRRAHSSGTARTRVRSRRRLAAPCR